MARDEMKNLGFASKDEDAHAYSASQEQLKNTAERTREQKST